MNCRLAVLACTLLVASAGANAADWTPHRVFIAAGGVTVHGTYSFTAGVAFPWQWERLSRTGEWTAATELFASHWTAKQAAGGREGFTQVAVAPLFRFRFDRGRSPWFAEGGIGLTWIDGLYATDRKRFSTRFNFYDAIGAGFTFGAQGEHEIGLRFSHVSNAGIRHPNPGENFLQLRYARNF